MAVTTGKDTGTTSSGSGSSASPGSGGQRGAGSNYGPGSGKPGTTSSAQPSSTQASAPGKTDKEATPAAPTSAPGKTDKVGTSEATKKPGLAGIQTQRQQAAFDKQKDIYTQAGGASTSMRQASKPTESAKVTDPSRGPNRGLASTSPQTTKTATGKTDKEASPDVAKPTGGIVSRGPNHVLGGLTSTAPGKTANLAKQPESNILDKTNKLPTASVAKPAGSYIDGLLHGSLLGARLSQPNMAQTMAGDPMSYDGPRAGTTPAVPGGVQPNLGISDTMAAMGDIAQRAQQGTLLSDFAAPAPKAITDRVEPTINYRPSMADPRLAQMQEQFNRIAAGRGQVGKVTDVASPTVQDQRAPMPQSIPSPVSTGMLGQPAGGGMHYPGADGVTSADLGGVFDQPTEIDIPGYPQQVAPSQQGSLLPGGNVFHRSPGGLISDVKLASDKVRGVGDVASPVPARTGGVAPSQQGSYPADENFMQDDGQPQSLGELSNRYDYEKGLAKQGLKDLPGKLFDAITKGDIRGLMTETNDKRVYTQPQRRTQASSQQQQIDAVARLLALIKAMEQQGGSLSQADLVNSTFN